MPTNSRTQIPRIPTLLSAISTLLSHKPQIGSSFPENRIPIEVRSITTVHPIKAVYISNICNQTCSTFSHVYPYLSLLHLDHGACSPSQKCPDPYSHRINKTAAPSCNQFSSPEREASLFKIDLVGITTERFTGQREHR